MGIGRVFQPARLQATYFPVWVCDGWASFGKAEKKGDRLYIGMDESHIPGFAFEPLSRMTFADPADPHFAPIPFTDDLRKQHGLDVLCLPYAYTPNDILSWLRTNVRPADVGRYAKALPQFVTRTLRAMVAWYPVLLPVYIAKYEGTINEEHHSLTFALEGYRKNGAHWMEASGRQASDEVSDDDIVDSHPLGATKDPPPAEFIRTTSASGISLDRFLSGGAEIQEILRHQANAAVHVPGFWPKYDRFCKERHERSNARPEDFEDPRIFEHTDSNRTVNQFAITGSLFREMFAQKLAAAFDTPDDGLSYSWFSLSTAEGEVVSSFESLAPEGGYTTEGEIPEAEIDFSFKLDKSKLAHLKMPISIKLVHDGTLLGQIHANVTSSEPPPASPASDTTPAGEEQPSSSQKDLNIVVRWRQEDEIEYVRSLVGILMQYLGTEKYAWVEKWEEENGAI